MRISYLLSGFGDTGGFIVLYNFMDNLVKRGYEVYAVSPDQRIKWEVGIWHEMLEEMKQKRELRKKGNRSIFSGIRKSLKGKKKEMAWEQRNNDNIFNKFNDITYRLLEQWQESDVTVATHYSTSYAGYYLSDRTVPLYHMQHYEELFSENGKERLIIRNSYFFPLIKIANSKWLQNTLKKQFGLNSYLLNPGIDLKLFRPYKDPPAKYKTDKRVWTIVTYFDERREWKGFDDAVRTVSISREKLSKKGITLNWKIYGIREPRKNYNTNFEFVGTLFGENLARLYSEADIVVLPSWFESFPLPPIEAMACGSLIITTRYGTEDYVFDMKNGLVTLPRENEEMARKIVFAVENPLECMRLVEDGLKTVDTFSWEKRTDVLEEILQECVKNYSFESFKIVDDLVRGNFKEYIHEKLNIWKGFSD